jgi:hypothetical protein
MMGAAGLIPIFRCCFGNPTLRSWERAATIVDANSPYGLKSVTRSQPPEFTDVSVSEPSLRQGAIEEW